MKKNLLAFIAIATLMNSTVSLADCIPLYREKIKALDNRMMGFKTTIVSNMAAEGVLVAGLAATTGTVAVGGVLLLPAASVAAGSYLGVLAVKKARYKKVIKLLKDAQKSEGNQLKKFVTDFERDNGFIASSDLIAKTLVQGNLNNEFCSADEYTEKVKLLGPKAIKRLIERKI